MNKNFKTGDIVVDAFNHHGIVIKYRDNDTLLLLIQSGEYYNTLESLENRWTWVDYYSEFEQILKRLGE